MKNGKMAGMALAFVLGTQGIAQSQTWDVFVPFPDPQPHIRFANHFYWAGLDIQCINSLRIQTEVRTRFLAPNCVVAGTLDAVAGGTTHFSDIYRGKYLDLCPIGATFTCGFGGTLCVYPVTPSSVEGLPGWLVSTGVDVESDVASAPWSANPSVAAAIQTTHARAVAMADRSSSLLSVFQHFYHEKRVWEWDHPMEPPSCEAKLENYRSDHGIAAPSLLRSYEFDCATAYERTGSIWISQVRTGCPGQRTLVFIIASGRWNSLQPPVILGGRLRPNGDLEGVWGSIGAGALVRDDTPGLTTWSVSNAILEEGIVGPGIVALPEQLSVSTGYVGDFDLDGRLTAYDRSVLAIAIQTTAYDARLDLTNDGVVDLADYAEFLVLCDEGHWRTMGCQIDLCGLGGLPQLPDGVVDGNDFNAFVAAFAAGDLLADVASIGGDAAPDGFVTGDDFTLFIQGFANGCP